MKLIFCLDEKKGMMFNGRRQSQDRVLRERILGDLGTSVLWMNAYSFGQFGTHMDKRIRVAEDFPEQAGKGEFCFVENRSTAEFEKKAEQVIVYEWNRSYPADQWWDFPIDSGGWRLVSETEFAGSSHEKITKKVYEK